MTESPRTPPLTTRGRIAKEVGCNVESVRYYEQIGLMHVPQRSPGGYRLYGAAERRRLWFILRARELGFSIDEVRSLLSLVDGGDYSCGEIRDLTLTHLADVRDKIADLRQLERTLAEISSCCEGGSGPDCPIVEALFASRAASASTRRENAG